MIIMVKAVIAAALLVAVLIGLAMPAPQKKAPVLATVTPAVVQR
jgi:hypothetical protein